MRCAITMIFFMGLVRANKVDLIVFSKNRPLQLYAFLESCEKYITGLESISVIYCADSEFQGSYTFVKERFPQASFLQQAEKDPYADFKDILCRTLFATKSPYVLFAVDDIVVIDTINLERCVHALRKHKAYAFYLRLGKDITHCYADETYTGHPKLKAHADGIFSWKFYQGAGDWKYPHTLDMALYRKSDIVDSFQYAPYDTPNTLEHDWSIDAKYVMKERGLCFKNSKVVNLPLNLVQQDYDNRYSGECSVEFLLEKFKQGLRLDISALHQFPHHAPHAEYVPTFILR